MAPLSPEESREALRALQADWLAALEEIKQQNLGALDDVRKFAHGLAVGLVSMMAVFLAAIVLGMVALSAESKKADAAAEQAKALAVRIETEGRERRSQQCVIQETKQKADVDALAQTYRYLAGLSRMEMGSALNRAVLANLPRTVREAQTDDAPPFCDRPGVGLPEPDPVLPKRPRGLPR